MKQTIKDVLDEMISNKPIKELIYTKKAYEQMEIRDAISAVSNLLYWQKVIVNPDRVHLDDEWMEDKMVLENVEVLRKRFEAFFTHVPELSEIFELNFPEVTYSKKLSSNEIKEIQLYINEHHKILRRVRFKAYYW
jgi:hypothetical protein